MQNQRHLQILETSASSICSRAPCYINTGHTCSSGQGLHLEKILEETCSPHRTESLDEVSPPTCALAPAGELQPTQDTAIQGATSSISLRPATNVGHVSDSMIECVNWSLSQNIVFRTTWPSLEDTLANKRACGVFPSQGHGPLS